VELLLSKRSQAKPVCTVELSDHRVRTSQHQVQAIPSHVGVSFALLPYIGCKTAHAICLAADFCSCLTCCLLPQAEPESCVVQPAPAYEGTDTLADIAPADSSDPCHIRQACSPLLCDVPCLASAALHSRTQWVNNSAPACGAETENKVSDGEQVAAVKAAPPAPSALPESPLRDQSDSSKQHFEECARSVSPKQKRQCTCAARGRAQVVREPSARSEDMNGCAQGACGDLGYLVSDEQTDEHEPSLVMAAENSDRRDKKMPAVGCELDHGAQNATIAASLDSAMNWAASVMDIELDDV
jgi:hypothetical protein